MGINEFAGYVAVALAALLTGYIATVSTSLRPAPFYPGLLCAAAGLVLSTLLVRDTSAHAALEASWHRARESPSLGKVLLLTSWRDR